MTTEENYVYVIVRKSNGQDEYLTVTTNPEIICTNDFYGAKLFDTKDEAERELEQLKLSQDGFIVEEHLFI